MALMKIEYYRKLKFSGKYKKVKEESEDEYLEDTDSLNLKYLPNKKTKVKKPKFEVI